MTTHCSIESTSSNDEQLEQKLILTAIEELPYRTQAYSSLMKLYEKRIYWMCHRIICDDSEAHDATQEVLIRVFHHLPKFKSESSFKTWLYAIARNVSLTMLSKTKNSKTNLPIEDKHKQDPKNAYNPNEVTDHALDIDKAFSKLDISNREILSLKFVGNLSVDEIAEALDIKLSAAKMRLHRATQELRKLIE